MKTNIDLLIDLVEQRYDKELAEKARLESKRYKAIEKAAEMLMVALSCWKFMHPAHWNQEDINAIEAYRKAMKGG